jgi:predicted phosphodiesterase
VRIAIVADIHGNLPALEAVVADLRNQAPDEVWCGGDLGWSGPWAAECIDAVRSAGWPTVRGNTDVWITGDPQAVDDPETRAYVTRMAEAHDVGAADRDFLLGLPLGHSGPGSLLLVHASPQSPFDAPMPDASAADFSIYLDAAAVVLYGHVHRAFVRRLADGTLVANTGSVGLPADADSACYAVVDLDGPDCVVRHRRVDYDRDAAITAARRMRAPIGPHFLESMGAS